MSREMPDRFALIERAVARSDFAADVRRGLNATPKFLLPIYFYDALGSALFDAICELPEYYVTRAETSILTAAAKEIVSAFGTPIRLVELGSGMAGVSRRAHVPGHPLARLERGNVGGAVGGFHGDLGGWVGLGRRSRTRVITDLRSACAGAP